MKRSIIKKTTAFFLASVMILGNMPLYTYAADIKKTFVVENVSTHVAFWGGTHYVTYTINGVDYDSRTAGSGMNLNAFRAMDGDDKYKVSRLYYPGKDRDEQYGKDGAAEIADYVNDDLGYKHAWKVMHDRAQNYCKDLIPYYGGVSAEDDPNRYYEQEYTRLNTFTGDAKTVLDNPDYSNAPEAQVFREKMRMMNDLMATGKQAYDNCVKHNEFAREAAVKATSAWLIKFIVENTIVPGLMAKPSATAAGVDSAMNTVYDQVLGMISEITGSENVSVTAEGNLVNLTIGKMGGQNISLKKGAAMVTYMRELADKNYKLAKYAHEKADEFHNQLESEATELIKKIDERLKKEKEAIKAAEDKERENELKINTDNVKPNTSRYSSIEPVDGSDEAYKEYEKKLVNAAKALDAEVASLYSQMLSEAESVSKSAGYYVKSADGGSFSEDYVRFEGYSGWCSYIITESDPTTYNYINTEEEYKARQKLYDDDILLKNNCILKINTLESSLTGVIDRYSVLYKELYARMMALQEKGAYILYTADWSSWNKLEGLFDRVAGVIYEQTSTRAYIEASLETLPDKHKENMEDYENRKQLTKERLAAYLEAQTNFNLAAAQYADIISKQAAVAQSELPDYVYTQYCQSYTATILLANNETLLSKINAASDKNKFFASEAKKLEECLEKFSLYEKQKEVAYNYAAYYLRELQALDMYDGYWQGSAMLNIDIDRYGLDPKEYVSSEEMKNELSGLYKKASQNVDDRSRMEICELLYRDFTGTGVYHNNFLKKYNEMVEKASYYKRKIASGELTVNSFNYYYADELLSPYNTLYRTSLPVSYTKGFTNVGADNEKSFSDMMYGENGILNDIRRAEYGGYVFVEEMSKQNEPAEGAPDATLAQGGSAILQVSVLPQNANEQGVFWYSEDPLVADVDQNGNVTGVGAGTTVVYAVSKDAPFTAVTDENDDILYYTCEDGYAVSFNITVTDEIISPEYFFGDADADNLVTASDAAFVLQKTLVGTFELPIEGKTDNWLKYVDVDADTYVTASDAAFILQKTLVSTFELPAETK